MTFREWERQCDNYMFAKYGVGVDDIPDQTWYDWYDCYQLTPEEAVELAIDKVNREGF